MKSLPLLLTFLLSLLSVNTVADDFDNNNPKMTNAVDSLNGYHEGFIPKGQENLMSLTPKEVRCLEVALWYEARGEKRDVIELVAMAIVSRSQHPEFPDDVCKVISQPGQFSFITEAKGGKTALDMAKKGKNGLPKVKNKANLTAKAKVQSVANDIAKGKISNKKITHFHDNSLKKLPKWTKKFPLVAKAGNMKFYRMP